LTRSFAAYWAARWRACLPPPADAELRAERLRFDLERLELLSAALAATDAQSKRLLAETEGQVLTTLPGVKVVRAAACAGQLPVGERLPARAHLAPGAARAPRRADGDRLGPVAALARLPVARTRVRGARLRAHPGAGRARSSRLPALSRPASDATALRRGALLSGPVTRAVTAKTAMPHDGVT